MSVTMNMVYIFLSYFLPLTPIIDCGLCRFLSRSQLQGKNALPVKLFYVLKHQADYLRRQIGNEETTMIAQPQVSGHYASEEYLEPLPRSRTISNLALKNSCSKNTIVWV